jgi:hypothetical protein
MVSFGEVLVNGWSEPLSVNRYSVAGRQDSDVAKRNKLRWSAHWKSRPRPSTESPSSAHHSVTEPQQSCVARVGGQHRRSVIMAQNSLDITNSLTFSRSGSK